VLKNSVSAQSKSILQNTFPLERPLVNYVCDGVRFERHVLVLEYDFAVVEFFKKSPQIALFLHRSEGL